MNTTRPRVANSVTTNQCRMWRILWWASYFRDTWLSFGMGRPTRINLDDCDAPVPTTDDIIALCADLPSEISERYMPTDEKQTLPRLWNCLMDVTFALGNILTSHYRVRPVDPTLRQPPHILLDRNWNELITCRSRFPGEHEFNTSNLVLLSHLYHLNTYYELVSF